MSDLVLVPRNALQVAIDYMEGSASETVRVIREHLVQALAQPASEPKPVEHPVGIVDESDDGIFIDLIYGENGNPLKRGDLLFTRPAPAGVVDERAEFEVFWASCMNTQEMDLYRLNFPMQKPDFVQPYACHETQRAWLAWQARAKLNGAPDTAKHQSKAERLAQLEAERDALLAGQGDDL